MEQKKLKWKDIYNSNKQRKYNEIIGIKNDNVELESNSFKTLKKRKYIIIISILVIILLLVWTFRRDIKMLFVVLAFFGIASIGFFVFNYFKLRCEKDGLYVRFGFQEGKFPYNRVKNVYLSRFNDYNFFIPTKKIYSVVIRYTDNFDRLKELSFPNYFLTPEDTEKFLSNFDIKEAEEGRYVQYERIKLFKLLGKIFVFVFFALLVLGVFFMKR
ncbi:MAG: hypothetical protein IKN65_05505 [Clostridia bacterium]|nr:hypothetical protein [Clostridia bacterium]